MKRVFFFEYEKKKYSALPFITDDPDSHAQLKDILQQIWNERKNFGLSRFYEADDESKEQQFFTFYDNGIKAGKYVGEIRFKGYSLIVIPKVLEKKSDHDAAFKLFNSNMLWWLSWSSKIKFPRTFSSLGSTEFDFLDILIFMFASITRDDLIFNKHQAYVEQEETLQTVRGRIDFARYSVNHATSYPHLIPCVYDSLEIDNDYNRVVKFTSRFLIQKTELEEVKNILGEITWILDEVSNAHATAAECDMIVISPLKPIMRTILDYCKMFLSGMAHKNSEDDLEIFSFMVPMEVLYEDFIFNFIKDSFEGEFGFGEISGQGSGRSVHLAKELVNAKTTRRFLLKPDIYLHNPHSGDVIADTKYKKVYSRIEVNESDRLKSGASVIDIYQMLAYAVKFGVSKLHLLYPDKADDKEELQSEYIIESDDTNLIEDISIQYHRLPVIIKEIDDGNGNDLQSNIAEQENNLRQKLTSLFCHFSVKIKPE